MIATEAVSGRPSVAFTQSQIGDAIIFDYRVLHRGGANNSNAPRPLAYITYARENDSHMTQTIRMHAVECRQLFKSSAALMNKLGGTASNVIEVLPDLRLGVEENEPELAELFFTRIRGWIKELKEESRQMMDKNSAAIRSLNISMENAKQGLFETVSRGAASLPGRSKNKMLCSVVQSMQYW